MRNFTFFLILILFPVIVSAQRRARTAQVKADTLTQTESPRSARGSVVKATATEKAPARTVSPKSTPPENTGSTNEEVSPRVASAKATSSKTTPARTPTIVKNTLPKSPKVFSPKTNTIYHKIGDDHLSIKVSQYGDAKEPFFINLHDDEITAVSGAKRILEGSGGILVRVENNGERNIRFKLDKKNYAFDPNRIFSKSGVFQTLNLFGKADTRAVEEVEKFAARILQLLPAHPSCIIALHNNADGLFSVTSYFSGREREKDAKAVSARPNEDPDDLFLTTDSTLFFKLRKEKFNIVWQDNTNAFKDGSLSIYCGEKNICYLNCETEHGKLSQYWEMISTAYKHLKRPASPAVVYSSSDKIIYSYKLSPGNDSSYLSGTHDIYFGEKKIGTTKLVSDDGSNGAAVGQLEIVKTFPLYDNMDLLYIKSGARIELRIDPTRQRTLQDPANAVVTIRIVP